VKLGGADLRSAKLINANLSRADLSDADLIGADLRYPSYAQLSGTDLSGTNLRDADLRSAKLVGAINFYEALHEGIYLNEERSQYLRSTFRPLEHKPREALRLMVYVLVIPLFLYVLFVVSNDYIRHEWLFGIIILASVC